MPRASNAGPKPSLGHLRIEIVEDRSLLGLGPVRFRWRSVYVSNGQIGVWSESYSDRRDCEASIRAHRIYLGDARVVVRKPDGKVEKLDLWTK